MVTHWNKVTNCVYLRPTQQKGIMPSTGNPLPKPSEVMDLNKEPTTATLSTRIFDNSNLTIYS